LALIEDENKLEEKDVEVEKKQTQMAKNKDSGEY
jgi:hypothetical protein